MKMTGNTILLTGGGSGIGRALAEKFQGLGNQVVIAGRNARALEAVTSANPGMESMVFDVADPASIAAFVPDVTARYPGLNVVVNNAGIMQIEDITQAPLHLDRAEKTVATNLLGPIRLTSALLPHLLAQPSATVVMVSSALAFVPMVATPTYSAVKSAIHTYAVAIREQLRSTSVGVIEIIPPYVQTQLMGEHQATDPNAMPLNAFIDEVTAILGDDPGIAEVVVGRCAPLRNAVQTGQYDAIFAGLNAHR